MEETMLDKLGELLVKQVRDAVIVGMDEAIAGNRRDIYSKYIFEMFKDISGDERERLNLVIPHLVDSTISVFLQLIDQDDTLMLSIKNIDGSYTDALDLTDGLEGEYAYGDSWVDKYSKQRRDSITAEASRIADQNYVEPDWDNED